MPQRRPLRSVSLPSENTATPASSAERLFGQLGEFMAQQSVHVIDIALRRDARRFLAREFPAALPLRLEHMTFPAYEPPLQRWWLHWHDYYEIIVPLEGAGRFQIGDAEVPFEPGHVLLVDTLKLHGGAEVTQSHRSLVIFFPSSFVTGTSGASGDRDFLAPLATRHNGLPPGLPLTHPHAPEVMAEVLALAKAYWAPSSDPVDTYLACKVSLLRLLHQLRRCFPSSEAGDDFQRRQRRLSRLEKVLPYIEAHFHEPLEQPEMARIAGMSPSRFRAYFKETTGSTLSQYVKGLRIAKAAEWLRETDRSLADIAAEVGFADQSHLFRIFREVMGCGPLDFRKRVSR